MGSSYAGCNLRLRGGAAAINWGFSTQDARSKLHRLYPCNSELIRY